MWAEQTNPVNDAGLHNLRDDSHSAMMTEYNQNSLRHINHNRPLPAHSQYGSYTYIYTNMCFSDESTKEFIKKMKVFIELKTLKLLFSKKWQFGYFIPNIDRCENLEDIVKEEWGNIVLFNFQYDELKPIIKYVKWYASNYIDESNLKLISCSNKSEIIIDTKYLSIDDFDDKICPYILNITPEKEFNVDIINSTGDILSVLFVSKNLQYRVALLKSSIQCINGKEKEKIYFICSSYEISRLFNEILHEQILLAKIFPANKDKCIYLKQIAYSQLNMDIKKFLSFEIKSKYRAQSTKCKWNSFPHTSFGFSSKYSMNVSISEMSNIQIDHSCLISNDDLNVIL